MANDKPYRRLPVLALLAVSAPAVLSGCEAVSRDHFTVGSIPKQYHERHPIVIDEREHALDIPVARDMHRLPLANESQVENMAFQYRRAGASGQMTVMMPSGSPNQAAARLMADRVVEILIESRVPPSRVRRVTYNASHHGNAAPVRISYHAVSATVSGCGEWPADLARSNGQNTQYHNFGCASQSNLAAMVSNPADLLGPRGMSDIDASRRNQVIDDYREGAIEIVGAPGEGLDDRILTKPGG